MDLKNNIDERDRFIFDEAGQVADWQYSKDRTNYDIMYYEGLDAKAVKHLIDNNSAWNYEGIAYYANAN